ncbi:MAG: hypothetical protein ACK4TB_14255 [Gemmobacter sp.]
MTGCAAPLPDAGPYTAAMRACRAAAAAQGLRVRGTSVRGMGGAGLGGAERLVAAEVTLYTRAAARRCIWTAGTGTAVIRPM